MTCTGCIHWRGVEYCRDGQKACHYSLDTGHTRAHAGHTEPASQCTHYSPVPVERRGFMRMVIENSAKAAKQNTALGAGTPSAAQGK